MDRSEKTSNLIRELCAEFLARESNRTTLITITHADVSPDMKRATIYATVLPESKEKFALDFLKRKRTLMREYLKKKMSIKNIPFLDVVIDYGEKNRQRIDELLRQ